MKSEIPGGKLENLLKILHNQNNFINNLFGKMRKLGLFINDVENNRVFPNNLWYKLGYTDEEMLNLGFIDLVHPDDLQKVKDQSVIPASQGKPVNKIIFRFCAKNGSWHWLLSTTISIITDKNGFVRQYIGFDSDITEEMELKSQLEEALKLEKNAVRKAENLATTDPLTGAKNRRAFFEYASQQEKLYKRYGTEFSVIMLDIDFFKKINDNYGHQIGDSVLKDMVTVIQNKLRDSDYLCRYGGEEFAILLPQSDESEAYETAERIRKAVKTQVKIKGSNTTITVSIGCASLHLSKLKNVDALISMADKALYYVKNKGRNQSQRYSTMNKE